MQSDRSTPFTAVLIERAPASKRPREAPPGDVVFDIPDRHDVIIGERRGRLTVTVARRDGRPETREVLAVSLQGAEIVCDDLQALVYAGYEFVRGDVRAVTVTLVRT